MSYDATRFGRNSRNLGGPSLVQDWQRADVANANGPEGSPRWVPVDAIWPREDINPRRENARDAETVARYAEVFSQLPPIVVQAETFALIDGRHRLDAARRAGSDLIRIVEVDVPEAELIAHAVRANVVHGRAASPADRKYWAKDFARRYPDWSIARLAEWTGASQDTIRNYRRLLEAAADAEDVNLSVPETGDQVVGNRPPARITGKDGKSYPVRAPSGAAAPRVQTFDPDEDASPVVPAPLAVDPWESHKRPASAWKTEPEEPAANGWGLPQTPIPIERGRERPPIDDLPDNDGEPQGESFVHLLDGFELRATVTSYVPDPQGAQAARYAASVRVGVAKARAWLTEIERTYGL